MVKEALSKLIGDAIKTMPGELIRRMKHWDIIRPSPYNKKNCWSFYNSDKIDWNFKPEGSLRVSNHWNFTTHGKKHCITNIPVPNKLWIEAKYHKGVYHVIGIYDMKQDSFISKIIKSMVYKNIIAKFALK
jgi:hypothetical protein